MNSIPSGCGKAAVKDGKLSAYCLVTMGDERSAMFDQISVSAGELGMGVILLPFFFSMEQFFEMGLENEELLFLQPH